MTGWPQAPVVYEVDTWVWLRRLADSLGRPVTLGDVPDEAWAAVAPEGVDAVWLMGVWERSPAGLQIARSNEQLMAGFRTALPDLADGDVVGSPYCVRRYVADERLGGPAGLAAARAALGRRGVRLVLDYVPNHVAPDHPWVEEHPERFVRGTPADAQAAPEAWFVVGDQVLAHGRDPYFPPWPDVVQLDAFDPGTRTATAETLAAIGDQCDGVRCDMAMLMTNDVFAKTWGEHAGSAPPEEFWPTVLRQVRRRHPEMVFIAEAYWDLEWTLQQQGFDFCYDKRLYDRLAHEDARSVRWHLTAGTDYQRALVRFIENHDEPRAASTFSPGHERAAAVTIATVPGATLWHDGQFEGRRVQLPVFLGRGPDEPPDPELADFHRRLVAAVSAHAVRDGTWTLLDCTGWPDNRTCDDLVAWSWDGPQARHLVVVNLGDHASQGQVALPWGDLRGSRWQLTDLLSGAGFGRDGDELAEPGLFVDLPPWGSHVLSVSRVDTP